MKKIGDRATYMYRENVLIPRHFMQYVAEGYESNWTILLNRLQQRTTMTFPDPYETLQVPHTASSLEIRHAYFDSARKYHPDKFVCCQDEALKYQASSRFAACAAAYSLLSDSKRKAEFDHIFKYGGYDEEMEPDISSSSENQHSQQTRKRKSVGIGYSCHDPCAFLWTQGKIKSRGTVAGIQIPSKIQSAGNTFRVAYSSGRVVTGPSGTTQCISETTQYYPLGKKKHSTSETTTYHPDGRREVVVVEIDRSEGQFSSYQNIFKQKEQPWYVNAWNQVQDKLAMCYNPCAAVEAQ